MNPPHSRAANSNVAGIVCLDKLNSMVAEQRAYPRKESVSPDASAVVESHTNVSLARHPAGISLNTVAGEFFSVYAAKGRDIFQSGDGQCFGKGSVGTVYRNGGTYHFL